MWIIEVYQGLCPDNCYSLSLFPLITHPAAMCVTALVIAQLGAWGMYRISTEVVIVILHLAEYILGGTRYMSEETQFSFI